MKVTLISGIPGSGKSTWASKNCGSGHILCSADAYFLDDHDVYRFDPSKLGEAHGACLKKFVKGLMLKDFKFPPDGIVVDNTSLTVVELAPYVALCQAYDVPCRIVTILCDPVTAHMRCRHGVPLNRILDMEKRLIERELPPFWNVEAVEIKAS